MLCRKVFLSRKMDNGKVPVYLNVYDLTPMNGYTYWLGLGAYHSGVQVHEVEYAFGAHDHSTTGIFEVDPKKSPGFTFRKSILIGGTDLGPLEVRAFMEKLAQDYCGNTYHLITKNCNHFCNDMCLKLTGKPVPRWVNRLARLGFLCYCVLPAGLSDTSVRVKSDMIGEGDNKKLRSQSSRYSSSNHPCPQVPSSALNRSSTTSSVQKCCLPSSSLIHSSSSRTPTVKP